MLAACPPGDPPAAPDPAGATACGPADADGGADHALLTDFGIARSDDDTTLTGGEGIGTPAYISPQVADGATPTPASDVFSLGATLHAAALGDPPFDGRIVVAATSDAPTTTRCDMAEALTQHVVAMLHTGPIPRRTAGFAATSLAQLDACALPSAAALTRIPGIDPATAEAGFAHWSCSWTSPQRFRVQIVFDRNYPYTADDGQLVDIAGRSSLVEPGGYSDKGCAVDLGHRRYRDAGLDPVAEYVIVDVTAHSRPTSSAATPANWPPRSPRSSPRPEYGGRRVRPCVAPECSPP